MEFTSINPKTAAFQYTKEANSHIFFLWYKSCTRIDEQAVDATSGENFLKKET